jgi:DNA-binding transcriptional LysR family regulator
MQRFNWDDLRFLLAISRGGSVSAAARSLSVDHATVIRRLEGLERALNAKLFQRNLRGYSLTVTGERLLISAKTMEEEATRASAEMGQGRTTISSWRSGWQHLVPRIPTYRSTLSRYSNWLPCLGEKQTSQLRFSHR